MNKKKLLMINSIAIIGMLAFATTPVLAVDHTVGNKNLLDALNVAIKNVAENGKYDEVYQAWFQSASTLTDDSDSDTATTFPALDSLDHGGTLHQIIENRRIVFGADTTYPPFEYTLRGTIVGFSVDLGAILAAELSEAYGVTITSAFTTRAWDPIIPDLQAGTFDAILSSMTKTPQRAEEIDFTRSYYTSSMGIIAAPTTTVDDNSGIDDLNQTGVRVALQQGTTSDTYAMENLQSATIVRFDSFDKVTSAVLNNDTDYAIGDNPVVAFYASENSGRGVKSVGAFGSQELFGVGVRKDTGTPTNAPTSAVSTSTVTSISVSTQAASFPILSLFVVLVVGIPIFLRFKKKNA